MKTIVVIAVTSLALGACTVGKSWNDSLAEGRAALKSGDYANAEKCFQSAIKAAQAKYGENAGQTATCMTDLANMYVDQQEYRKAALILKDLVPIYAKIEPGSDDESRVQQSYAEVKKKIKKYHMEPGDEESKGDASKSESGAASETAKDGSKGKESKDSKDGKDATDAKDVKNSKAKNSTLKNSTSNKDAK